jgi:hypothetical protein
VSSILLSTAAETGGAIFTTGDSVGWRIRKEAIRNSRPHVNIFKVPHHGSFKNNQREESVTTIRKEIAAESALRELMELFFGRELDKKDPHVASHLEGYYSIAWDYSIERAALETVCSDIADALTRGYKQHNQRPADIPTEEGLAIQVALKYLNWLRQRHYIYILQFKNFTIGEDHETRFSAQTIFSSENRKGYVQRKLYEELNWTLDPAEFWREVVQYRIDVSTDIGYSADG